MKTYTATLVSKRGETVVAKAKAPSSSVARERLEGKHPGYHIVEETFRYASGMNTTPAASGSDVRSAASPSAGR